MTAATSPGRRRWRRPAVGGTGADVADYASLERRDGRPQERPAPGHRRGDGLARRDREHERQRHGRRRTHRRRRDPTRSSAAAGTTRSTSTDGGSDVVNCGADRTTSSWIARTSCVASRTARRSTTAWFPTRRSRAVRPGRPTNDPHAGSSRRTSRGPTSNARSWTAEDVARARPRWDFCTSPARARRLPRARPRSSHVRAVDDQTNDDPTPDSRAFTIDTVAPDTRIDSGPSGGGVTTTRPPSSSSPPPIRRAAFVCRFDHGDFFACPSPFTTTRSPMARTPWRSRRPMRPATSTTTPASVTFRVDRVRRPRSGRRSCAEPADRTRCSRRRSSSSRSC